MRPVQGLHEGPARHGRPGQGGRRSASPGSRRSRSTTPSRARPHSTGYNQTLGKVFRGRRRRSPTKNGGLFVDQFHPYLAVLDKARAAEPEVRSHHRRRRRPSGPAGPGADGGLHPQGAAASRRSSRRVEIDAAGPKAVAGEELPGDRTSPRRATASRFERLDAALPFFPRRGRESSCKWAPILEELNDYGLKVTGLKPGKYEVRLGRQEGRRAHGRRAGRGREPRRAGLAAGPVAEQVKAVKAAIEAKNRFHHDRIFRGVVLAECRRARLARHQAHAGRDRSQAASRLRRAHGQDAGTGRRGPQSA